MCMFVWYPSQNAAVSARDLQCLKGARNYTPDDAMQGKEPYPIKSTICYREWMWQTHL